MKSKLTSNIDTIVRQAARQQAVNEMSARRIAAAAKANAPRGATGDLAASVGVETAPGTASRVVVRDWKAHFQEFGTVNHAAQPFLVPAAEAERAVHIRAVRALFS